MDNFFMFLLTNNYEPKRDCENMRKMQKILLKTTKYCYWNFSAVTLLVCTRIIKI